MMNKLTWIRSRVLPFFAEILKEGWSGKFLSRLNEPQELLEKNAERRQQIHQFFAKGLLDPAMHAQESDVLTGEAEGLKSGQKALKTKASGYHEWQEALARLGD